MLRLGGTPERSYESGGRKCEGGERGGTSSEGPRAASAGGSPIGPENTELSGERPTYAAGRVRDSAATSQAPRAARVKGAAGAPMGS